MERRIQYAKTSDGVSIAFSTHGEGSPIVWSQQLMASHVQLEWEVPVLRDTYSTVGRAGMLVRFDPRGVGLSDREVADLSVAARVKDVEAVVDHLQLNPFDLVGLESGGLTAISYAAQFPGRVSHLLLLDCYARDEPVRASSRERAFQSLIDDWEMMTENVGMPFGFGWEAAKDYAEFIRKCMTAETYRRLFMEEEADLTPILPNIRSPSLIVRHDGLKHIPMEATRELTAGIPNARLHVSEGLYLDNQLLMTCIEFLGLTAPARTPDVPSGTAIILFADIVDSTALTERLGDEAFRAKARGLDGAMRAAIRDNGGTPVEGKTLGDGVLAVFTSAKQAIACAQACHEAASAAGLALHAGIHAGDVIREADNVYGGAVNIAARVASASAAGETLVSATVRELARTSAGVVFEDRGEQALKGVGEPVRVWAVREGGA